MVTTALDDVPSNEHGRVIPMDGPYQVEGSEASATLLHRLSARLGLLSDTSVDQTQIVGVVSSFDVRHPVLTGTARVVRDPLVDDFQPGEILVASSTTPDFVNLMRVAAAIVTDWGGQSSHAALTARELSIPCIIGTAFASSVIRSGEEISIDFNTGVITRVDQVALP